MLIDINTEERDALASLARDEIKALESGHTSYGSKDDDMDMISLLSDAITALYEEV